MMGVQLGSAFGKIVIDASGASKGAEEASQALGGLGSKASGLGSILGTVGIGLAALGTAAIAAGAMIFSAGMQMDEAYDKIRIQTGATGEAFEQLKGDVRDVFASVPTDAGKASDVISALNARLGVSGQVAQDMAKPLLEATRMMGGDAKTNTELFTRVMGDWGIANEDGAATMDKLFVASQKSGIGLDKLMSNVVQFGSPMRQMGFSIDDSVALFSKFEREGVNAELVMGSLRIAAGKFANEGKPLQQGLQETFSAIKDTTDSSKALSIAMDVFGARAGPDMAAAIREGRFSIDDFKAALEGSEGAITSASEDTMDFGEKFQVLKNKVTLALEPMGMKMIDVANLAVDKLGPSFEQAMASLNTDVVPVITGLLDTLGALISGDLDLSSLAPPELAGSIKKMGDAFQESLPTIQAFGQDMWAFLVQTAQTVGPQLVAGISGVLNTITQIWQAHGQTILAVINFAWRLIVAVVGSALTTVVSVIQVALTIVQGIFDFWSNIFQGKFGEAFGGLGKVVSDVFGQVIGIVATILENLLSVFGINLTQIGEWFTKTFDDIKTSVTTGLENARKAVTDKVNDFLQAGANLIEGLKEGIKSKFTEILATITGIAADIVNAINDALGISSPSWKAAWSARMFMQGFRDGLQSEMPGVLDVMNGFSTTMGALRLQAPVLQPAMMPSAAQSGFGGVFGASPFGGGSAYTAIYGPINYNPDRRRQSLSEYLNDLNRNKG